MDYSAAIADDPTAASPWGSSSPRAQRAPFAGATPDSPTTPGRRVATTEAPNYLPEPALDSPDSSAEGYNGQPVPSIPAPDSTQQPQQEQALHAQHPHAQHAAQQDAQQQRPGAVRYHNARQQRQVPQYKLQAKVTALERTGRKDPVLRFDVYVWNLPWSLMLYTD